MKKLYIIHGWTYTVTTWKQTIDILKNEYDIDVVMLNVPGLTSQSDEVWTIEKYVEWANDQLPDNVVALGHSNGGRILLNLCLKYPNKLKHLILLDSAGVYEESVKRSISRKLAKVFAPLKNVKPLQKVVHKVLGASDYDKAPENMKITLTNMIESDKNLKIEDVKTPTSILWGEKDTITPPRYAETIHNKIAGSNLTFYKNWKHSAYLTDPAGLARAISRTMQEIEKQEIENNNQEILKQVEAK